MELIPMVAFLKSYKNEGLPSHPPTPPTRSREIGLWQAQQELLSSFLAVRQVDISFECMLLWALMQRLLPRVPKWVGQWCLGCILGHSKKWSVQENKIYLLFLIKWCTVAQVMHIKRTGCFVAAFQGYRQICIINISVIVILYTCYMFTIAFTWQAIHTILHNSFLRISHPSPPPHVSSLGNFFNNLYSVVKSLKETRGLW